ncbi:MAG: hypothetical protein LBP87_09490 [Planctomycetaceae bacterium]|nr:hypothetical protein [Planctomycetaceae bacterium]
MTQAELLTFPIAPKGHSKIAAGFNPPDHNVLMLFCPQLGYSENANAL